MPEEARIPHLVAIAGCVAPAIRGGAFAVVLAVAVLVASVLAGGRPAGGQAVLELTDVTVSSAGYDAAVAELAATEEEIAEARAGVADLDRRLPEWRLAREQIRASVPELRRRQRAASEVFDDEQRNLRRLAAVQYVQVGSGLLEQHLLSTDDALSASRTHVLLDMAGTAYLDDVERYYGALTEAEFQLQTALDSLAELDGQITTASSERDRLEAAAGAAEARIPEIERRIAVERRAATVTGTDLPYVALLAYWNAARNQQAATPGCGLSWTVLAGIGRVESDHGRHRSSDLAIDGTTTAPIIGIILDGDNETAAIADTDGGTLDGDAVWDRAVGPMQFIPATWGAFARDGDGDGAADPHNLFDAAASAAAYLCLTGGLDDGGRLRQAILRYNYSNAYVDAVLDWAARYSTIGV